MVLGLFRKSPSARTIDALYGAIVAQARSPAFYADYGVPDTVAGRLEMIVLHLVLFFRRARHLSGPFAGLAQDLSQDVFDRFCEDIDHNFREMGVGDLAVPKKMHKVASGFYGRAAAYEAAMPGGREALAAALGRNVFGTDPAPLGARRLAEYMRRAAAGLEAVADEDIIAGRLRFADSALDAQTAPQYVS